MYWALFKNEQRIIALAVIICLCLLAYIFTHRHLRQQLQRLSTFIVNQLGQPPKMPTLCRLFRVLGVVYLLIKCTPEGMKG
ncbi:hypothetical protein NEOC65_001532 [Neochlamydia sp. AcF65]|nr:hypothetical protein [Neochlamydia sp. AcF65]MBS4169320.1 hypothetical protein [Neochlamydia sp. AcF95]NGY95661.1 hypothetical protein [Neochlamydia sp. AcF84]